MAATFTDTLKVCDSKEFYYEVNVGHHSEVGVSIAYYKGLRISKFEYGRYIMPIGDDDHEWEEYEERFRESSGGDALVHFEHECKVYFDSNSGQ